MNLYSFSQFQVWPIWPLYNLHMGWFLLQRPQPLLECSAYGQGAPKACTNDSNIIDSCASLSISARNLCPSTITVASLARPISLNKGSGLWYLWTTCDIAYLLLRRWVAGRRTLRSSAHGLGGRFPYHSPWCSLTGMDIGIWDGPTLYTWNIVWAFNHWIPQKDKQH